MTQQLYSSWLISTHLDRYTVTSFQTFLFTLTTILLLLPLKFAVQYFLPNIFAFIFPTQPTPSLFQISCDLIIILLSILLIQLVIHTVYYYQVLCIEPQSILPTSFPIYNFLHRFQILRLLGFPQSQSPTAKVPFWKIFLFSVFSLGLVVTLLCQFFQISTTLQPSTELFSYHQTTSLAPTSTLSPLRLFQSAQPIFWFDNAAYTIDCLSAANTASPLTFSTHLPHHSYSIYNPSYYPSLNQLQTMASSTQINISDALNGEVSDPLFTTFRQHSTELQLGTFSDRYDVEVVNPSDDSSFHNIQQDFQNKPYSPNIYHLSPRDQPLVPSTNKTNHYTIPSNSPTHATSRPLSSSIIQQSIPILSLHQFHKAQQSHPTPLITTIQENTIHTYIISNLYPFFIIPFTFLASITCYFVFTSLGVQQSKVMLFRFVCVSTVGLFLSIIIPFYAAFPLFNASNKVLLFLLESTLSIFFSSNQLAKVMSKYHFRTIFHFTSSRIKPSLLAVTFPTSTLSTSLPISSDLNSLSTMCPDTFSLAFIPYPTSSLLSISTLFVVFLITMIIIAPFIYHAYTVNILLQTPLNYSKYILQALSTSQTSSGPFSFLFSQSLPHATMFLSSLASKDQLYIALNNSALPPQQLQPIPSNQSNSPLMHIPFYTQFYMMFILDHCFNATTKNIYSLLFQLKAQSRTKPKFIVTNPQIIQLFQPLAHQVSTLSTLSTLPIKNLRFSCLNSYYNDLVDFVSPTSYSKPTVVIQLISDTLLLPTNLAVISGNVAPLVDQANKYVYSQHSNQALIQFLSQSLLSLLQLNQALEDLIIIVSTQRFPQPSPPLFSPQHLSQLSIDPDTTKLQAFNELTNRSSTLNTQTRNILISIYSSLNLSLQQIINHHLPRNKTNFPFSVPQDLTHSFNYFLHLRPQL